MFCCLLSASGCSVNLCLQPLHLPASRGVCAQAPQKGRCQSCSPALDRPWKISRATRQGQVAPKSFIKGRTKLGPCHAGPRSLVPDRLGPWGMGMGWQLKGLFGTSAPFLPPREHLPLTLGQRCQSRNQRAVGLSCSGSKGGVAKAEPGGGGRVGAQVPRHCLGGRGLRSGRTVGPPAC